MLAFDKAKYFYYKNRLIVISVLLMTVIVTGCGKSKETAAENGTSRIKESGTTVAESKTQNVVQETTEEETTEKNTVIQETGQETAEPDTTAENEKKDRFQVDGSILARFSNEGTNWGQGTTFDEFNRPVYAVSAQERNAEYGALFIMPQEKKLYITMDCGSSSVYMKQILDILKEKQTAVTFFVTRPFVQNNPEVILRMVQEGHRIGNHSVTHPSGGMFSLSIEQQIDEVKEVHDHMLQQFGYEMDLFRYPQGTYSTQSLALMQQMGYRSVFWSFAYRDYNENDQPEKGYALQKLKDRIHPGAIYLLHVDSKTNADILGDFIDAVREKGYELAIVR